MICQTKLNFTQQLELEHALENVGERAYVEGTIDGESAYQAYNFYGEENLGPRFANELRMCFNTSKIKLIKGHQALLIDDLLDVIYECYRIGTEDGESAFQDYDLRTAIGDRLENNINVRLRKYDILN